MKALFVVLRHGARNIPRHPTATIFTDDRDGQTWVNAAVCNPPLPYDWAGHPDWDLKDRVCNVISAAGEAWRMYVLHRELSFLRIESSEVNDRTIAGFNVFRDIRDDLDQEGQNEKRLLWHCESDNPYLKLPWEREKELQDIDGHADIFAKIVAVCCGPNPDASFQDLWDRF